MTGSSRIYMKSSDTSDCSIIFGAVDDAATGAIRYDHSDDTLRFSGHNNSQKLYIDNNSVIVAGGTGKIHASRTQAKFGIDCHGLNVLDDVNDPSNYGMVFYNDPTTDQANGIGFFNDDGQSCGGYIIHQDKGGSNIGDIIMATSESGNTPVERLRITSDGNINIPFADNGTGLRQKIRFVTEANFFDEVAYISADRTAVSNAPTDLVFGTGALSGGSVNTQERLRIESDGQVIVTGGGTRYGGWAGGTPLNVNTIAMVNAGNADTTNWGWGLRGNSGDTQWCVERIKDQTSFADVNIKFRVYSNGNYLFAGSDQSDRDVKENILDITGTSLDKIKQLKPRTFNFIESEGYSTETKTGFIAQEVASVIPSITNGTDGQKNMGVDYNGLVAHLVKALQEATTEIETLKTKVAALEGS